MNEPYQKITVKHLKELIQEFAPNIFKILEYDNRHWIKFNKNLNTRQSHLHNRIINEGDIEVPVKATFHDLIAETKLGDGKAEGFLKYLDEMVNAIIQKIDKMLRTKIVDIIKENGGNAFKFCFQCDTITHC